MADNTGVGGSNTAGTSSGAHLEWILFENTILFNDVHFLQFPKRGSYFMIGQNGSGKSSVFELIRRCLGSTKNNSFSSFFSREKMSYVMCAYAVDVETYIISATFGIPSRTGEKDDHHVKFACELVKDKVRNMGVDTVSQGENGLQSQKPECSSDLILSITNYLKRLAMEMKGKVRINDIKSVVDGLKKCVDMVMSNAKVTHDTNRVSCNKILEALDTEVVHIFSAGSIGTLQWSKSERMSPGRRDANYRSACKRAEILMWYLKKKQEVESVNEYFRILTDGSNIRFSLEGSPATIVVEKDLLRFPLLKLSEGILEAMKFSIILGVDQFKTILYEDPERGMHPQMIQRMRDMILRTSTKTILITSHHPAFTTFWNLDRVFLFRPTKGTPKSVIVRKVPENLRKDRSATKNLSKWEYSTIFFAERIIFTEGDSDLVVVSELKDLLIKAFTKRIDGTYSRNRDGLRSCLSAAEIDLKGFARFLIGLEIIPVYGIENLPTFETICRSLLIDWLVLKDNDTLKRKKEEERTKIEEEENAEQVGNEFKWGNGEIEDVIKDFADLHDTVCSECETEEVDMHAEMAKSVKRLVGYSKENIGNQQYRKLKATANRSDVETFLEAAIDMLINEERYRNYVRGRQILEFVKFLFRHAKKANE